MRKYLWILYTFVSIFIVIPLIFYYIFMTTVPSADNVSGLLATFIVIFWFGIPSIIVHGYGYAPGYFSFPDGIRGWIITLAFYIILSAFLFWIIVSVIKLFSLIKKKQFNQ